MPNVGWKRLLAGAPWFKGAGRYPIAAYSEFMPAPRFGPSPYGPEGWSPFVDDDPYGWRVTEYDEEVKLEQGLKSVARQVVGSLAHLGRGSAAHGIARSKLTGNLYWPPGLAARAGHLSHERYVILMPLALSKTQDDQGRVRWTLFGGSEQGPERAFWNSFRNGPDGEAHALEAVDFLRRLLHAAYGVPPNELLNLRHAGFRIYQADLRSGPREWPAEPLPAWALPYAWRRTESLKGLKYLLAFEPFSLLPDPVQQAYLAGKLNLLPFPGSLLFWGVPLYLRMRKEWPQAAQVPLLALVARHEGAQGIRVPQTGWLHEPRPGGDPLDEALGPMLATYWRVSRTAALLRDEEHVTPQRDEKLAHVLFSARPEDVGLYEKPMARNAQMWTRDGNLLLDGPRASRAEIERAAEAFDRGGMFGYRFAYPPMCVGKHEVTWHRPLVAYLAPRSDEPAVLPMAPLGYLTAHRADRRETDEPVELWPRLLRREPYLAAARLFASAPDARPRRTTMNAGTILDARELFDGRPIPRTFARHLLALAPGTTLDRWLADLPDWASDADAARVLAQTLRRAIAPEGDSGHMAHSRTFRWTAKRSFEVAYWKTIAKLAHGEFVLKNNADCAHTRDSRDALAHPGRDLERLGDHFIEYYTRAIAAARLTGKALVGDLPFHWRTQFDFPWSCGWRKSQSSPPRERDVVVVIPGRDRRRAVIMADHYDTAYMADYYEPDSGGNHTRAAAAGADDNGSATAALMLAAPIFLELSRQGRLGCDIWLVHLTGEEFPADCLGARNLAQALVEGTLALRLPDGRKRDLSRTRVQGVFVLDMVAHNNDKDPDVFQISPGASRESLWLAYQAHLANEAWNASTESWNRRAARKAAGRGKRRTKGTRVPALAKHLPLSGEVRVHDAPKSTLYNTDGQIFSDAGIPVALFMENYDIDRKGYHDSEDTLANIDLDYGAALVAIAIESVARAACEPYMEFIETTRKAEARPPKRKVRTRTR